jgi:hypothetical protein
MRLRVGEHLLQLRPRGFLALPALLGRRARPGEAADELVTNRLELVHVDEVRTRPSASRSPLPGELRVGRELRLEPRDLTAEGVAGGARVGLGERLQPVEDLGAIEPQAEPVRSASRVEGAGELPCVDPLSERVPGYLRRELLERRGDRGAWSDERPESLPGDRKALVLQPVVDGARGIDIDASAGGESPNARELLRRAERAALDHRSHPPPEGCSDREIVVPIEVGGDFDG